MMKRILVLLFCVAMILSMVACNPGTEETPGTDSPWGTNEVSGTDDSVNSAGDSASDTDTQHSASGSDDPVTDSEENKTESKPSVTDDSEESSSSKKNTSSKNTSSTNKNTSSKNTSSTDKGNSSTDRNTSSTNKNTSTSTKNTSSTNKNTSSSGKPSSSTSTKPSGSSAPSNALSYDSSMDHLIVVTGASMGSGISGTLSGKMNTRVTVYNLNNCKQANFSDLESSGKVWESNVFLGTIAGVKFRYSAHDKKDVVLVVQSGGLSDGALSVVDYATKGTLRSMTGIHNAHSAEMDPEGGIIVAASGHESDGCVDGGLHYFPAGKTSEASFLSLPFAHAVVWDPGAGHFWAAGFDGVIAVKVENGQLVKISGKGAAAPYSNFSAHDMVPATGMDGMYWVSDNSSLWLFDSARGTLTKNTTKYSTSAIKGIAYFPDGTMVLTCGGLGNPYSDYGSQGVRIVTSQNGTLTSRDILFSRDFYKVHTFTKNYN